MNSEALPHLNEMRHVVSGLMHRLIQRKAPSVTELNLTLAQTLHRLNESLGASLTTLFLSGTLPVNLKNHLVALHADPLLDPDQLKRRQSIVDEWELQPACMDDGCACGQALRVGERLLIADASRVRLCHSQLLQRLAITPRTLALVPLRTPHGLKGCLICVNKGGTGAAPRNFSEHDAALLEDAAHYIGLLIDHCKEPTAPVDDLEQARILARLFRVDLQRIGPDTVLDTALIREFDPGHLRR